MKNVILTVEGSLTAGRIASYNENQCAVSFMLGVCFADDILRYTAVKGPVWVVVAFILLILLLVSMLFTGPWLIGCLMNDYVALTWNKLSIDGNELYCKKIPYKRFLVMSLLTLVTLGGYLLVMDYRINAVIIENIIPRPPA